MSEFSKLLQKYREEAELSQRALANLAGVDQSHLNRLERGIKKAPRKRTVLALANALQLGTKERLRLLDAAGYPVTPSQLSRFMSPESAQIFGSPFSSGDDLPTVQLVRSVLTDKSIPLALRKRIDEMIASFATWLKQEAKKWETQEKRDKKK